MKKNKLKAIQGLAKQLPAETYDGPSTTMSFVPNPKRNLVNHARRLKRLWVKGYKKEFMEYLVKRGYQYSKANIDRLTVLWS